MSETYPDRTSKVSRYTFTEASAEAQWAELAENPLLQRMNACRQSLAGDRKPQTAEFILAEDNVMTLRLFVDHSIVEVFADNQTAVLTRVYPERQDSVGVSAISRGRPAKIVSLKAYPMENIWAQRNASGEAGAYVVES